jgi:hypothetical protein
MYLDDLKHESLIWHCMWCNANKPNSGIVFQLKCIALSSRPTNLPSGKRLLYMKIDLMMIWAIIFLTKECNVNFGKTWLAKFRHNVSNDVYINGCNDSSSVANAFASHFSKVYLCNASSDKDDITLLLDGYSGK